MMWDYFCVQSECINAVFNIHAFDCYLVPKGVLWFATHVPPTVLSPLPLSHSHGLCYLSFTRCRTVISPLKLQTGFGWWRGRT